MSFELSKTSRSGSLYASAYPQHWGAVAMDWKSTFIWKSEILKSCIQILYLERQTSKLQSVIRPINTKSSTCFFLSKVLNSRIYIRYERNKLCLLREQSCLIHNVICMQRRKTTTLSV